MNKKQRQGLQITAFVFLVVAVAIMVHQWVVWQHAWEWDQFLHHENFSAMFAAAAVTLFVVLLAMSRKRH